MFESGQYQRSRGGRQEGLPRWIQEEPFLTRGEKFFLDAYHDLCTERAISMVGAGPIPWSKIVEYASLRQMDYTFYLSFRNVIRMVEAATFEEEEEERMSEGGKARRRARMKGAREEIQKEEGIW